MKPVEQRGDAEDEALWRSLDGRQRLGIVFMRIAQAIEVCPLCPHVDQHPELARLFVEHHGEGITHRDCFEDIRAAALRDRARDH